jgi:hypothetical protein
MLPIYCHNKSVLLFFSFFIESLDLLEKTGLYLDECAEISITEKLFVNVETATFVYYSNQLNSRLRQLWSLQSKK